MVPQVKRKIAPAKAPKYKVHLTTSGLLDQVNEITRFIIGFIILDPN